MILISLTLDSNIFVACIGTDNSFLSELSKLLIVNFLELVSFILAFHLLLFICLLFLLANLFSAYKKSFIFFDYFLSSLRCDIFFNFDSCYFRKWSYWAQYDRGSNSNIYAIAWLKSLKIVYNIHNNLMYFYPRSAKNHRLISQLCYK